MSKTTLYVQAALIATLALAVPTDVMAAKGDHKGVLTLTDRVVDLQGGVKLSGMRAAQKSMLELDAQSDEPIWLRINSPGGSVAAGLVLLDTMQAIDSPVYCVVESRAYSMGAIILTFCEKRYALEGFMFRSRRMAKSSQQRLETCVAKVLNLFLRHRSKRWR